jgi:MFS family permease
MSSTERRWRTAGLVAAGLVLVYSVLITAAVLLGLLTAALTYLFGWTVGRNGPRGHVERMGRRRSLLAAGVGVATVAYAVVVGRPLLGLSLALLGWALAWLTAPDGPLARLVRWVRAAREDLRTVRDAVVDDAGPSADD